jgi:acetyltransferase-like isoleucine patch superfamily enzyme
MDSIINGKTPSAGSTMAQERVRKIAEEELIRHKLFNERKTPLQTYKELVIGDKSLLQLIKYEVLTTLLGPLPGALGLILRKLFYPMLFKHVGKGVIFGQNVVIRHPDKIRLGNRVVLDDYCLIDARGAGEDGLVIGDDSIINRGVTIKSKVGPIHIEASANIGAATVIISMGGVYIGEMVSIAGGCSISGGAFSTEQGEDIFRDQGKHTKGPIRLDKKSRYAMGAIVLDGVHVEEGCIVGAGSVVITDLPSYSIAAGVPAKVVRSRKKARENGGNGYTPAAGFPWQVS